MGAVVVVEVVVVDETVVVEVVIIVVVVVIGLVSENSCIWQAGGFSQQKCPNSLLTQYPTFVERFFVSVK